MHKKNKYDVFVIFFFNHVLQLFADTHPLRSSSDFKSASAADGPTYS